MIPFALPYDPEDAPVVDLIGHGFRPAWQPADFIGPRMDCPMWLPAPDADIGYSAKFDPFGHVPDSGYAWGTWLPTADASHVTAAALAGPLAGPHGTSGSITPSQPWWPFWPPHVGCCVAEPHEPVPPIAPVPVEAGTALLLITALAALIAWRHA